MLTTNVSDDFLDRELSGLGIRILDRYFASG